MPIDPVRIELDRLTVEIQTNVEKLKSEHNAMLRAQLQQRLEAMRLEFSKTLEATFR